MRIEVMSTDAQQRRTSTLAGVDHATLLAAVAAGRVEAVEEIDDRHASALYRLALLIARDRKPPEDAVAGVFIALWRAASSVDVGEQSFRAALAGVQRDLLALILLGVHICLPAARRVGLVEDAAARMMPFALRTVGAVEEQQRRAPAALVAGRAAAPAFSLSPRRSSAS